MEVMPFLSVCKSVGQCTAHEHSDIIRFIGHLSCLLKVTKMLVTNNGTSSITSNR
jgi:hypothetical protein